LRNASCRNCARLPSGSPQPATTSTEPGAGPQRHGRHRAIAAREAAGPPARTRSSTRGSGPPVRTRSSTRGSGPPVRTRSSTRGSGPPPGPAAAPPAAASPPDRLDRGRADSPHVACPVPALVRPHVPTHAAGTLIPVSGSDVHSRSRWSGAEGACGGVPDPTADCGRGLDCATDAEAGPVPASDWPPEPEPAPPSSRR
jgi:hypothetical protein